MDNVIKLQIAATIFFFVLFAYNFNRSTTSTDARVTLLGAILSLAIAIFFLIPWEFRLLVEKPLKCCMSVHYGLLYRFRADFFNP